MFTTDLVNLYNRNIFITSLYIDIFPDEKCRLMSNLSLSMVLSFALLFEIAKIVIEDKAQINGGVI